MEIGKRNKIIYPFRLLISPMSLRWPSNVLFRATRLAIGGKRVMARVSHIEKPQSPELQGFGEGDKFLSFLLVGSNSGVSGKTQNQLRQFPWFRRWPLQYKDFLQLNMYVGFHVPPQCPSDFSEATLGVGFENTKAGVLELVDEVDSKSIASDGVRVRVPPPAPSPQSLVYQGVAGFFMALSCPPFA